MGRKEKLSDLIADRKLKGSYDTQFGLVSEYDHKNRYVQEVTNKQARRSMARKMMAVRKQILRKHGVRIVAWSWFDVPKHPGENVMCLALKMFGKRATTYQRSTRQTLDNKP